MSLPTRPAIPPSNFSLGQILGSLEGATGAFGSCGIYEKFDGGLALGIAYFRLIGLASNNLIE